MCHTFHTQLEDITSLQIIFFYKLVICQARDKVGPDMKPVWSNKKEKSECSGKIYFKTLHDLCMNIGGRSMFTGLVM